MEKKKIHVAFRKVIKFVLDPLIKRCYSWYKKKTRTFSYNKIKIHVHPEVFPPIFTISTKILLKFIEFFPIKDKTFLELGCGSGIISLFASSQGALVTATDINNNALAQLEENAKKNNLKVDVIYSDLFENISSKKFDFIFINPPYYPKIPTKVSENAWFCGENFEYFTNLFKQLSIYLNTFDSEVYMILSEDCEISKIVRISETQNLKMKMFYRKIVFFEYNYIYKINLN